MDRAGLLLACRWSLRFPHSKDSGRTEDLEIGWVECQRVCQNVHRGGTRMAATAVRSHVVDAETCSLARGSPV